MFQAAPALPETMAQLFEDACFPFWIVNTDLDIVYFNKRTEVMHSYSHLTDGLRMLLSPVDCEEVKRLIALGQSFNSAPSVMACFPATALSFTPFRGLNGRYEGAYVVLTPVTEDPDSVMDLRTSLLSASTLVVAHEFKKCVSEIFYSLSVCASKLKNANVDLIDDQLHNINQNCYQILRNTSNVAERVQYASNIHPTTQCVDFWDNCAELLEACNTLLRSRQAKFCYELPDTTSYVDCNFEKITTALLHLLSNAYLHCQNDVQVTISGRDTTDSVVLIVKDNGPGILAEVQDRIFQPFSWGDEQLQGSTMGLGLNIVRNIVAQAGGKLVMHSDEMGTTMTISLPRVEQPALLPELYSTSATYMQDRFSALYVILCDVVTPPEV